MPQLADHECHSIPLYGLRAPWHAPPWHTLADHQHYSIPLYCVRPSCQPSKLEVRLSLASSVAAQVQALCVLLRLAAASLWCSPRTHACTTHAQTCAETRCTHTSTYTLVTRVLDPVHRCNTQSKKHTDALMRTRTQCLPCTCVRAQICTHAHKFFHNLHTLHSHKTCTHLHVAIPHQQLVQLLQPALEQALQGG